MKKRGLLKDAATFAPAGRETNDRVEALTDQLAVVPYQVLETVELDELMAALGPLAQQLNAARD